MSPKIYTTQFSCQHHIIKSVLELLGGRKTSIEKYLHQIACRQVCRALSSFMINAGGPSPLCWTPSRTGGPEFKKKKKSRLSQPRGGSAAPWLMPQFLPRVPALTSLKVINLNKPSPPQVGFGPDAFSWQQKH